MTDRDEALRSIGLDPDVVRRALSCGLYESEQALIDDVLGGRTDNFTKLTATATLVQQTDEKCYVDLIKTRAYRVGTIDEEATKAQVVYIVDGPARAGAVVTVKHFYAPFTISRSGNTWTWFTGGGNTDYPPLRTLARRLRVKMKYIRSSLERVVRTCADPAWQHVASFPIETSTIGNGFVAQALQGTPFVTSQPHAP